MARILLIYETFDGHTARIVHAMAAALRMAGHEPSLRRAGADADTARGDLATHDAVIVGGAIRYGRVAPVLEKFASANAHALARLPNAFFTVCLSAGGPGARPAEAGRHLVRFTESTGWTPHAMTSFAGALQYSKYGFFRRLMMRLIVGHAGGDTDTSHDYEYTDWRAVERFATDFAAKLALGRAAA